jgi:PHD/YefM family antitoxin component YafN of YafNO toxin-antitoxin module
MIDLGHVHPVTDFVRNYKSFPSRIRETGKPAVLTVNGRPEFVILDTESYQAIANELEQSRFIRAVNEGIEDMNAERRQPLNLAFAQIRAGLEL